MSTKTIILHVGHPKTGSSYLQSGLASNVEKLRSAGILYPYHSSFDVALKGNVTSGNCRPKNLGRTIDDALAKHPEFHRFLFSSEAIYEAVLKGRLDLAGLTGKGAVEIILFIRNPFEYAVSRYGQRVKGEMGTESFGEFLAGFNPAEQLVEFLTIASGLNMRLHVANYSRCKNRLLDAFAGMLDLSEGFFKEPQQLNVNRSLTRSELYFMREFNKGMGRNVGRNITDPLCNQLPDIPNEPPYCRALDVEQFLEKTESAVNEANRLLPESARLDIQSLGDVEHLFVTNVDEVHKFSNEQVDLLAGSMTALLKRMSGIGLGKEFSVVARDLAIRMEKSRDFSLEDALNLMQIAQGMNPSSPMIKKKIKEYKKKTNKE